jgi:hypothetical protein
MSEFTFESDAIALPKGAWAKTHRHRLRHGGRSVLAVTQGDFRPYVYPLFSPAGFMVSSEAPADHPHHSSLWIGADHVHAQMPAAHGSVEEYTYNFYVNETFQGRAPGRMVQSALSGTLLEGERFEITQTIEWRGPDEWAAGGGRLVAMEERTMVVTVGQRHHRIDVTSRLSALDWAIKLGPTRHAWFNIRVADSMIVANGGTVSDDRGRTGGAALCGEGARWVDFSCPVGGGHLAGITVVPHPQDERTPFWFVADWGVVTVGPFRIHPLHLDAGETFEMCNTVIVHDGDAAETDVAQIARDIPGG